MSDTMVLERPTTQTRTSLKDQFLSPAEEAHAKRIADNFRRLRFNSAQDYNSARDGEPVSDTLTINKPITESPSFAASRIAQYTPVETPAGKQDLFDGYVYRDGKLETPQTETANAASETLLAAAAPAANADEDDAVPTRRTMDTLRRPAAQQMQGGEVAAAVAVRPALSTKMKAALAAVMTAIVLVIALICINSGIIRSIDADIAGRRAQLDALTQETQSVQAQIDELRSPESIAEWAARNNMVRE